MHNMYRATEKTFFMIFQPIRRHVKLYKLHHFYSATSKMCEFKMPRNNIYTFNKTFMCNSMFHGWWTLPSNSWQTKYLKKKVCKMPYNDGATIAGLFYFLSLFIKNTDNKFIIDHQIMQQIPHINLSSEIFSLIKFL